jgi:hypothetical protein
MESDKKVENIVLRFSTATSLSIFREKGESTQPICGALGKGF